MSQTTLDKESFDVCAVLEAEFERLHGPLGPEYPRKKTPDEREPHLRARVHALPQDGKRAALCLSGGGIRSATFCLGALQGLAARDELDKFHYLSTVSGGGYIGSWLSKAGSCGPQGLASVVRQHAAPKAEGAPDPEPIRRLRAYSNYLSPVWGISTDFFTLIATLLRNLVLHWLVLLPLIAAVLMLVAAMAALAINRWVLGTGVDPQTYSRYGAPLVEELFKSAYLLYLLRARRIGFAVDAAIAGFAIGTGFAFGENTSYLVELPSENVSGLCGASARR